jgi:hypothetical protein
MDRTASQVPILSTHHRSLEPPIHQMRSTIIALDTAIRNDHTVIVFSKDTILGHFCVVSMKWRKCLVQTGFRLIVIIGTVLPLAFIFCNLFSPHFFSSFFACFAGTVCGYDWPLVITLTFETTIVIQHLIEQSAPELNLAIGRNPAKQVTASHRAVPLLSMTSIFSEEIPPRSV